MKNDVILKLHHIEKVFPGVVALDDVLFELRRGEVHVLLGENGAGKSTLIKIVSGAYQKTRGQIFIEGKEIIIKHPRHAQMLGISTIYQELNLIPHLTVGENIFLGRESMLLPGVIDDKRLHAMAQEILDDLGVKINSRSPVRALGIAEKQMVEVAKALSVDAKILIMDEPTSALTDREIEELFSMIRRLKENGVSIIYISHRLEEIYEIGDRVTVLRDGNYIGTNSVHELSKQDLIRMMVNRELKEQYPRMKTVRGDEILRIEKMNRTGQLRDITFSVYRGEILGIAGLLGSGRTELARILFGADKYDDGKMIYRDRVVRLRSPRQAIRLGIGFLTEDRKSQGLILNLNVKNNICLPSINRLSRWGIMNIREENRISEQYIQELNIKTTGLHQKVMYLSGGNQQKVVMSKWLCIHADILIFDEPTRGIDVGSKVEIYRWMNRLKEAGVAIIMISSEMPEILGMSDRILVMHEGSVVKECIPEETTQEMILQCALGV